MSSVILTSYFTKKKHPNSPQDNHVVGRDKDGFISKDDFSYIEPWYNSVNSLKLSGYIFHDGLSSEFVSTYETDNVKFIQVEDSEWSNLDYRWFCYKDFLDNNQFENVFLTDCSDVKIVKNPSLIFDEFPEVDIFLCKDSIMLNQFPYIDFHDSFNLEDRVWFLINQNRLELINMGVIGGSYKNIKTFLDSYKTVREGLKNKEFGQADMFVGQYLFRRVLKDKKLLIGSPFCSEFKGYQEDRDDVYFIHK